MMLFPDVKSRLRRKYARLTFAFGYLTLIVVIGLLIATVLAPVPVLSIIVFAITFLLSFMNVFRLAYMVLGTRGEAHYFITFWNMLDTFVANLLSNIGLTMIVWNVSVITGTPQYKLTDVDSSPFASLLQLGVFTVNLMCGAGIVREEPLTLLAESILSPQTALNLVVILLIVAPAAIAALGIHTDEQPGEMANVKEKRKSPADV